MPPEASIATIGPSYGMAPEISFFSDANLYEFDVVILNPEAVFVELTRSSGAGPFGNDHYWKFVERSEQISEWVADGHTLVLLIAAPGSWVFNYVADRVQYTKGCSLYAEMKALSGMAFESATGNRIDYVGPRAAKPIFEPHLPLLRYLAIISSPDAQALLQVRTITREQNQMVACVHTYGEGQVICVPMLTANNQQHAAYLKALAALPLALLRRPTTLPDWVGSFCLEEEIRCRSEIDQLNREIEERVTEKARKHVLLDGFLDSKTLFGGTGEEFKDAVKAALQELGLKCVDGPHPRADLLASHGTRPIAIEAKGLDSNARESNFRQVERWKAEVNLALSSPPEEQDSDPDLRRYSERLALIGVLSKGANDCKGVLIIGTFRSTPLDQRTEPDFPEPLVRLLAQADVCAMTGLQLFELVAIVRHDPSSKEKVVDELLNTSGVFGLPHDWRRFLTHLQ